MRLVKVYRNLKHGTKTPPLYSVMYKGRVIKRVRRILLNAVEFRVSQKARERVLKTKRKNVHAYVVGVEVASSMGIDKNGSDLPVKIQYNPYTAAHFHVRNAPEKAVKSAAAVLINENGISGAYVVWGNN